MSSQQCFLVSWHEKKQCCSKWKKCDFSCKKWMCKITETDEEKAENVLLGFFCFFFTVNQKRLRVKLTAADRGWTYISTLYVWVIISQQTLNVHPLCFQHCWLCKNVIVGLCSGSYARSVQAASYTEFPASLNDELRSNWEQKKPTQIQRQMHWFKRGISKDQKWTPFFPSLPSSPSHTHSSHSLCDNQSLDERRGPPWPSITYRRCDNPCVRFMAMFKVQLLQSKIPHIVFCVLRVCVYINTECCQRYYQLVFLKLISFLGPCVYTQPLASLPSCKLWYLFMLFIWFFYYI